MSDGVYIDPKLRDMNGLYHMNILIVFYRRLTEYGRQILFPAFSSIGYNDPQKLDHKLRWKKI